MVQNLVQILPLKLLSQQREINSHDFKMKRSTSTHMCSLRLSTFFCPYNGVQINRILKNIAGDIEHPRRRIILGTINLYDYTELM